MTGGARGIRAGRAFVELGVDDKTQAALRAAEQRLKAMAVTIGRMGTKLIAVGGAASTGLGLATREFAKTGDAIEKAAARTGIGAEALSELGYAAEQSGASLETVEKGSRGLSRTMLDAARGSKEAVDSLSDLGLTYEALASLSPEQQFMAIAEAVSRVEDPSMRAALAMKVLGRSGADLLPMFQQGAAGIDALRQQARAFGLTVSGDAAKAAAELGDSMDLARRSVRAVAFQIGGALARAVTRAMNYIAKIAAHTNRWVQQNKGLVVSTAKVVGITLAAGGALVAVAGGLVVASKAMGLMAATWAAGKVALAAGVAAIGLAKGAVLAVLSPLGLVSAAIVGTAAVFVTQSGLIQRASVAVGRRFGDLKDIASDTLGGIVKAIQAGDVVAAMEVLSAGVYAAWVAGVGDLKQLWIDFKQFMYGIWDDIVVAGETAWSWARKKYEEFNAGASKRVVELREWVNLEKARATGDPKKIEEAEKQFNEALIGLEKANKAKMDDLREEIRKRLEEVNKTRDDNEMKLQEEFDVERLRVETEAADELERARERLNEALKNVSDSANESARRLRNTVPDGLFDGVERAISDFESRSATGTFTSEAIERVLDSQRTKSEGERVARNSDRILKILLDIHAENQKRRHGGIILA